MNPSHPLVPVISKLRRASGILLIAALVGCVSLLFLSELPLAFTRGLADVLIALVTAGTACAVASLLLVSRLSFKLRAMERALRSQGAEQVSAPVRSMRFVMRAGYTQDLYEAEVSLGSSTVRVPVFVPRFAPSPKELVILTSPEQSCVVRATA